jgi:hypothetical protein
MANKILHKRSDVSGNNPPLNVLSAGEIAINTADGFIFYKKNTESGEYVSKFVDVEGQTHVLNKSLSSFTPQFGENSASEVFASVLGGFSNDVSGAASTTINGEDNDIESDFSIIGNGLNNKIKLGADHSFIAAGQNNLVSHSNVFTLGSNLSSHANDFTYVNNLSAQGVFYGDGSGLTNLAAAVAPDLAVRSLTANWDSTYTTVQSNSSTTWSYQGTDLKNLSSGWVGGYSAYTNLVSNSAAYLSGVDLSFLSVSANWDSTYTTVQSNSSTTWSYQGTDIKNLTGFWDSVYSSYYSNSASYTTITFSDSKYVPLSGATLTGTLNAPTLSAITLYGDGSNLTGIVAGDTQATTFVRSNSSNWDSTYTTVNSKSASWDSTYTTVSELSSNWQTTFQASSAYVSSNPDGITGASSLTKLLQITQDGYNSITPASDTLYIIVG